MIYSMMIVMVVRMLMMMIDWGCGAQGGCYTTSRKEELQLWSNLRVKSMDLPAEKDLAVQLESMTNLHRLKNENEIATKLWRGKFLKLWVQQQFKLTFDPT